MIQLDAHNDFDSQNKDREPLVKTPPDLNAIFSGIQLQNIVPQQDILKAQSKLTLIAKLELTLVQVLDYIFEKTSGSPVACRASEGAEIQSQRRTKSLMSPTRAGAVAEEGAQQKVREKAGESAREKAREKARERERLMQQLKASRLKLRVERAGAGRGMHPQVHLLASHLEGEGQQSPKQRQSLSVDHEPSPSSSPSPKQTPPHVL